MASTDTNADGAAPSLTLATDVVGQAREIVTRRGRAEALLGKAEGNRDKVKGKIYERVKADYQSQLRAIAEEYAPVRDRIVDALRRIRAEERRLRARLDVVNEELEELRFRCEVGEFSADDLKGREKAKLVTLDDLNAKLKTIDGTYGTARELLGADADAVLKGPAAGGGFSEEVAIDVGANSGVLPSARAAAAAAAGGGGKSSDITIEEPGAARVPARASSSVAIAEPDEMEPLGDQGTFRRGGTAAAVSGGPVKVEGRAVLKLKSETGEEVFVLGDQSLTIGRNPKNDIVLLDRTISRQHARVGREGGRWVLTDLSSGSGLVVNGARTRRAELNNGDQIEMGDFKFTFEG